ncbi:rhomboid family membrane protein [Colletotrichum karsti]|uniref:Rhomboid family membrane protein n=1 Tax=Colletotrichum karsti TaxID=1095194 RepID=A0A9P6LQX0_9PEZI|nr:rhomboid family membrane protein [Colletotrichum karsti]KAF9881342.1 rhomboid family membrane protein [Colletotrichum karsti]
MAESTTPKPEAPNYHGTPPLVHNFCIAAAVASPILMILPPRRMDWRFFMHSSIFSASTNQLMYDYTGQSIYQRVGARFERMFPTTLPEQAQRTKQALREERMRREGLTEEQMRAIEYKKRSLVQRVWYGNEPEDWDKKRGEEHSKALAEGKGLGDLIVEQVKEVWDGEKGKKEEGDGNKKA